MSLVCGVGLFYILITNYQNYNNNLHEQTKKNSNHVSELFEQAFKKNLNILPLIKNQWQIVDNATTGSLDALIGVIEPLQKNLNIGIINIYDKDGLLIARADKPALFGVTDALSTIIKTINKETRSIVIAYEGKVLLVSLSPIIGNYGKVAVVASGQFIKAESLQYGHAEIHSQVILLLNGKQVLANANLSAKESNLITTQLTFPAEILKETNLQGILIEDISKLKKEFWIEQLILLAVVLIASVILIVITRKMLSLTNQLERSQRDLAERKLEDSEAFVHLLLDSTAEAIYGVDTNGNCTFINQACLNMLGYKDVSELLGKNMHVLTHYKYPDGTKYPIEKCKILQSYQQENGSHVDDEVLWRKDGSSFPVEYWSYPIFKNKECIGAVVTFLDITKRIKNRIALQEREENLSITLNSIGDAVITTDNSGCITRMNPIAEQLTGWSFNDAEKKPLKSVFNIINASSRKVIDNPVDKVLATGEIVYLSNHATLISKDGSEYQIADSAAPIRNGDDAIQGMVLVFNNVTEQYKLREIAAKSKRDLQAIMDHSPAVIYVKDVDGKYVFINQRFTELFHIAGEEIIGKEDCDIFPRGYAEKFQFNDRAVLKAGHAIESEEDVPQDDGIHHYISNKFPLFNEAGDVYAMCGISTDVTIHRKQDELIRRSQKMDALGKLTGGIAHDYNNMLGVILGYTELLEDVLAGQTKPLSFINEMRHASERGVKLTKKLLSFSRKKPSDADILNLNSVLQGEHDMLQKTLTARIKLIFDLSEDVWEVYLDNSEFEDAIVNLCINAMHAIEGNGTLTIQTENITLSEIDAGSLRIKPGDYIELSLIDTGCGMDEKTKDKMFEPFFSTKGEMGTGLGLSQVYGFVERSQGAIKVYSEINLGTRLTMYFPRYLEDNEKENNNLSYQIDGNQIDLKGTETILVVDDEPALTKLTEQILGQYGYHVLCATSAKEALDIIAKKSIDLLFTDIIMPEMDGYELVAIVKEKYPDIKIQMVSGFSDTRHENLVDDELHKNLLTKPYQSELLLKKVRKLLN